MSKSAQHITDLAFEHGINVKPDTLKFNESGLDFLVVFATDINGENWVLRIPRRPDVMVTTSTEKKALDLISPYLSVEAPQWQVFTNELIAYKQLRGVPAATIDAEAQAYVWVLDANNVPAIFNETLAGAMVSLHRISQVADARQAGLKVQTATESRASALNRMQKVKAEFGVNPQLWQRWQTWLDDDTMWPDQTGLVHGDLHAGHILIDEDHAVTGFIDWTEAAVADTAVDFVVHYRCFGRKPLDDLIRSYERAGGYVWPKMAAHVIERTAFYPVDIAEFALKSGLEEYLQMTREALGVDKT